MSPLMPHRRILSLWFPRLGAERLLRQARGTIDAPFAVIADSGTMQVIHSLSGIAESAGLRVGQPLRDAMAICPALITRLRNEQAEAAFLQSLRRWAGKYSPWVAEQGSASLIVDLTGCAHLFGGEPALLDQLHEDCTGLELTLCAGIADTLGAAWALARYAGADLPVTRSGDAIDQEAHATRSRAAKRRHWERGGPTPMVTTGAIHPHDIAPKMVHPNIALPGQTRQALAKLPVAALRLEPGVAAELTRLGLRRIEDLANQPRAPLARRFGRMMVRRLDQALGVEPEPVSPAPPPFRFAVRLTLPDPVGLESDLLAALDRLLPPLGTRLEKKGRGARRVRMQCFRSDNTMQAVEVGLARPSHDPDRIRPLLAMRIGDIDAGFGIDMIRIEAVQTEPLTDAHRGHAGAANSARARVVNGAAMDDLIGRLGARIGLEQITRRHPADSHLPEKSTLVLAAAWSDPAPAWRTAARSASAVPRPLMIWPPEPVAAPDMTPHRSAPPAGFRWRRRDFDTCAQAGPERIAPEWWLDDPAWRSGVRDYWRVTTVQGDRLWLFFAHGATMSPGWFCHGSFG